MNRPDYVPLYSGIVADVAATLIDLAGTVDQTAIRSERAGVAWGLSNDDVPAAEVAVAKIDGAQSMRTWAKAIDREADRLLAHLAIEERRRLAGGRR